MIDNPVDIYIERKKYPCLLVMQTVIARAVRAMARMDAQLEAIALIRGAYILDNTRVPTVKEAKSIYQLIVRTR